MATETKISKTETPIKQIQLPGDETTYDIAAVYDGKGENIEEKYLPLTAGPNKPISSSLYTSFGDLSVIGTLGKVGMRAKMDGVAGSPAHVGQINISDSANPGKQWQSQMTAYDGIKQRYNGIKVSHNGPQYVIHEKGVDTPYDLALAKDYLPIAGGTITGNLSLGDTTHNNARFSITSKNPYIHFVNLDEPEDKRISWYVQAHKPAGSEAAFYIGPTFSKAIKIDGNGNLSSVGTMTASGGFKGTADKATADADGANIASTYLKKSSILTEHVLSLADTEANNSNKPFVKNIDVNSHTITVTRGGLSDLGLSTVYDYKGSKTWTELLNITSAKAGDVYHVSSGAPDGKGSSNWACYTAFDSKINGANYNNYWQPLGGIIDLSGYALLSPNPFQWFDGEQRMKNSTYCPTMFDIASGIGCSLKNTRALDNQVIIGELLLPYTSQNLGGDVETEAKDGTLQSDPNNCQVTAGQLGVYLLESSDGSLAVENGKIKHKRRIGTFSSKGWVGNVTGNVTGNADSATEVLDYGDTKRKIKIGFAGTALTADEISHIAGYTDNGEKIKDVGKKTLQDWLSCLTFTKNDSVNVVGNTKTVYKTAQDSIYVPNGLIMGGSAAAAGLVTRGICGIEEPSNTGAATKHNLYINYDNNDTWNPNGRGLVINAGSPGTDLGQNMYSYCAVRGDIVKAYCDAHYFQINSEIAKNHAPEQGIITSLQISGPSYEEVEYYGDNTISYGDPGPQIIFKDTNSNQVGALIFSTSTLSANSVNLNFVTLGNGGYFVAPYIKALKNFVGDIDGNSSSSNKIRTWKTDDSATYGNSWTTRGKWINNDRLKFIVDQGTAPGTYTTEVDHAYRLVDPNTGKSSTGCYLNVGNMNQAVCFKDGVPTTIDWRVGNETEGEHDCNKIDYNFAGYFTSNGPGAGKKGSNPPSNGALWSQAYSNKWVGQIAQDYRNGSLFVRGKKDNAWQDWRIIPSAASEGTKDYLVKFDGTNSICNSSIQDIEDSVNFTKHLIITPTKGNWREGIRINAEAGDWVTIALGATGTENTNENCWSIHRKNDNNFAICRNSSDGTNGLVMTNTGMGLGTTAPAYRLDVNGTGRFTGALSANSNVSVGGTLTATGATTLNSTLAVTGATTLNSTLTVAGATELSDALVSVAKVQATKLSLGDNKKAEKAYYEYNTSEDCVMLVFN